MSGYSGTPLAKKLNLKDGQRVLFLGMPSDVRREIDDYGLALNDVMTEPDAVHIFVTERAKLVEGLERYRDEISQNGQIWVSWPKRASKVATEVTEDTIREVCLPLGLVDIKVCSVNEVWSGLKLVIRKELREGTKR